MLVAHASSRTRTDPDADVDVHPDGVGGQQGVTYQAMLQAPGEERGVYCSLPEKSEEVPKPDGHTAGWLRKSR